MARKRNALALPSQATKDIKAVGNIVDRWSGGVEDLMKDAFAWAKKHKFLVLVSAALFVFYRYWLAEDESSDDEDY